MEADLQRYYHLPLSALGTRRLTWRKFGNLVLHLPSDSATVRAMNEGRPLPHLEHRLLAAAIEQLMAANWQRGGGKGRRPQPIRLPGDPDDRKSKMGRGRPIAEARRILDNWSSIVKPTGGDKRVR